MLRGKLFNGRGEFQTLEGGVNVRAHVRNIRTDMTYSIIAHDDRVVFYVMNAFGNPVEVARVENKEVILNRDSEGMYI